MKINLPYQTHKCRRCALALQLSQVPGFCQGFQVVLIHFDRDTLHDLLESQHHSKTTLPANYHAFHARKGTRPDPRQLAHLKQRMRFNPVLLQCQSQSVNRRVRNRRRFSPGSSNYGQCAGNTQNTYPFRTLDPDENVAGKEWEFQRYSRPVSPFPVGTIQREVMLDFALPSGAAQSASRDGRSCKPRTTAFPRLLQ